MSGLVEFVMASALFSGHALEICENEVGEVATVATFQQAEHGDAKVGEGLAEPVKILGQQGAFGERVAGVGIEAGGDGDEIGLKTFQIVEGALQGGAVEFARGGGGDGIVETIFSAMGRAGVRVGGELMHGKEGDAGMIQEDVFGAVAVMYIEIKYGDAMGTGGGGLQRGDGDVIEVAKAHGIMAGGMMAGWAHEAENVLAGAGEAEGIERSADGSAGETGNALKEGSVGIKILGDGEAREHLGGMGAENGDIVDEGGCRPMEGKIGLIFEVFDGSGDAQGTFGMTGLRVAGAFFIRDDGHEKI
jgi:hypothetical protein